MDFASALRLAANVHWLIDSTRREIRLMLSRGWRWTFERKRLGRFAT